MVKRQQAQVSRIQRVLFCYSESGRIDRFDAKWGLLEGRVYVRILIRNADWLRLVWNCGLHPLIHTFLKFNLAQDIWFSQRFTGLGNDPTHTGHTFSVGFIIRSTLHLGHLTVWSLTRLVSSGSKLVIRFLRFRKVTLWWSETGIQWVSLVAVPAKNIVITVRPGDMLVCAWTLFGSVWGKWAFTLCHYCF